MKGLEKYPTKVLVAWGEAISGNKEFIDVLIKLKYTELGVFCHALKNDEKAKKWLLENNFPHLLALIEAAEGRQQALDWLEGHKFSTLKHMALAIDGDETLIKYFMDTNPILGVLTSKMKFVKDTIEGNNRDPHKINP